MQRNVVDYFPGGENSRQIGPHVTKRDVLIG